MRFERLFVRLGSSSFLLLGLLREPGCGGSTTSSFESGGATAQDPSARGADSPPPEAATVGSEPTTADAGASAFRGNPLCRLTSPSVDCLPDEDGTRGYTGYQCLLTASGTGVEREACRVGIDPKKTGSTEIAPHCESATAAGTDGTSCTSGKDCASGFDCVQEDKGAKCRHYCCSDTCEGVASQSGGKTFCDVQQVVASTKVPVCMPLKECKLLTAGQCLADETCAVVNPNGDTGCVRVGAAQVNDSCETEHCAVGLTCIGQPGSRKCYALCKVGAQGACGASLVCKTSALFKDPSYGVCQKPMSAN